MAKMQPDTTIQIRVRCTDCKDGPGTGWSGDNTCNECDGKGWQYIAVTLAELADALLPIMAQRSRRRPKGEDSIVRF